MVSWAEQAHGLVIARTMGMVTLALFLLFFSIESKDERESAFSLGTFADKTYRITTGVSFVLLVLSTGVLHGLGQERVPAGRHRAPNCSKTGPAQRPARGVFAYR